MNDQTVATENAAFWCGFSMRRRAGVQNLEQIADLTDRNRAAGRVRGAECVFHCGRVVASKVQPSAMWHLRKIHASTIDQG